MISDYELRKKEYDLLARKIMSQKQLLSYVLKYLVKEYQDLEIDEIYKLIEAGDGSDGKYIKGINTNDTSDDKEVRHDIVFTPMLPNSDEKIGMYIGIEPQKDNSKNLERILKRAIYYDSRMISRQANEAFENSEYDKLKKTYSIWLLFNPPSKYKNSILRFSLAPFFDMKRYPINFDIDYNNIIIINLGNDHDYQKEGLLELLSLVFNNTVYSVEETSNKLKKQYNLNVNKEDIDTMGGWWYGIEEKGIEQGIEQGKVLGAKENTISSVIKLVNKGMKPDEVFDLLEVDEEIKQDILQVLANN